MRCLDPAVTYDGVALRACTVAGVIDNDSHRLRRKRLSSAARTQSVDERRCTAVFDTPTLAVRAEEGRSLLV